MKGTLVSCGLLDLLLVEARVVTKIDVTQVFVAQAAILTAVFGAAIYVYTYTFVLNNVNERTVPPDAAARFEAYTGLTYDVSSGFGVASRPSWLRLTSLSSYRLRSSS